MEKHEVMKVLVLIESVYPDFRVRSEAVENWFAACKDMDYHEVMKKLSAHIRRSPYPPLLAEITAYTQNDFLHKSDRILMDEEGWIQVQHDTLLPKQALQMPWQEEYLVTL